jgi:arylsulfatase A-like enzyme
VSAPNILYLHSHDTGRTVQPYGHAVPTPSIQRLAEEGMLFRQAFCAAPTCSPSRAALLTGQSPHNCGQVGLANLGVNLRDTHKHVAHTLHGVGYTTALFGVQHLHVDSTLLGYDVIAEVKKDPNRAHPSAKYPAAQTTENAIRFLEATPPHPFFMSVGYFETHRPFPPSDSPDEEKYSQPPAPLPDAPDVRRDMAGFKASARILDRNIGAVLDALERTGLAENTLVICTTDHGLAFPWMKCTLTDHGTGIMLILRGPGGFAGGTVCDALVSHLDLYPTICELAGIPAPEWTQGRSLLPLARGEADAIHDAIFSEINYHVAYEPQRAVRTTRYKYIRHFGARDTVYVANTDSGPSKSALLVAGYADAPIAHEQLYDLLFDPQERHNLADEPELWPMLDEMRARLDTWMQRTDDPLLAGDVPLPPGAVTSPLDEPEAEDWNRRRPPVAWDTRIPVDNRRV